eukprot:905180-Lingulodinium_polyedra.AAC.1
MGAGAEEQQAGCRLRALRWRPNCAGAWNAWQHATSRSTCGACGIGPVCSWGAGGWGRPGGGPPL